MAKKRSKKVTSRPIKTVVIDSVSKMNQVVGELVNSKIEHTNPPVTLVKEKTAREIHSDSLLMYRKSIKDIGVSLKDTAIKLADDNLLNAKLGLWEAMAVIERMMKENRNT